MDASCTYAARGGIPLMLLNWIHTNLKKKMPLRRIVKARVWLPCEIAFPDPQKYLRGHALPPNNSLVQILHEELLHCRDFYSLFFSIVFFHFVTPRLWFLFLNTYTYLLFTSEKTGLNLPLTCQKESNCHPQFWLGKRFNYHKNHIISWATNEYFLYPCTFFRRAENAPQKAKVSYSKQMV